MYVLYELYFVLYCIFSMVVFVLHCMFHILYSILYCKYGIVFIVLCCVVCIVFHVVFCCMVCKYDRYGIVFCIVCLVYPSCLESFIAPPGSSWSPSLHHPALALHCTAQVLLELPLHRTARLGDLHHAALIVFETFIVPPHRCASPCRHGLVLHHSG